MIGPNIFLYSRSRDSNRAGSACEDAQSARSGMSDDIDDALDMLAAEISSRIYPTATSVIMEDSPEQLRSTSNSILPPTQNPNADSSIADAQLLTQRMGQMQATVEEKFTGMAGKIQDGQNQQNHIVSAADTLVAPLKDALHALKLSRGKHEAAIQHNEQQLNSLLGNNTDLTSKNVEMGQLSRSQLQAPTAQEERRRNLSHQTANLQHNQWAQQQKMGAHGQATLQMQRDMAKMRENNRYRPEIPTMHQFAPTMTNQDSQERAQPSCSQANARSELVLGPRDPTTGNTTNANRPSNAACSGQTPFRMPENSDYGFTPHPCLGFPNMIVDPCPAFAPSTFQNWKREIKLWVVGQPGESVTQLLAELIHGLPAAVKLNRYCIWNKRNGIRRIGRLPQLWICWTHDLVSMTQKELVPG